MTEVSGAEEIEKGILFPLTQRQNRGTPTKIVGEQTKEHTPLFSQGGIDRWNPLPLDAAMPSGPEALKR